MPVERLPSGRIAVRDLSLRLGQGKHAVDALGGVTFDVDPGQLLCILGPSGCGKSTLLGAVAGFLPVASGSVSVDAQPVSGPSAQRCMVFQHHTLLPWRSALDNVAFGLKMRGVARRERHDRARTLLHSVGLAGYEHHYPAQLSGGMQQRVELARALAHRPNVLLMDEPFGALDAQTRVDMQELLMSVWSLARPTILFVTHDVDEALFLADRVLVMSKRPGTVQAEFEVALPRPRVTDTLSSSAFVQLRRRCIELLRAQPRAPREEAQTNPAPVLQSVLG